MITLNTESSGQINLVPEDIAGTHDVVIPSTNGTLYTNRSSGDLDVAGYERLTSIIILTEIGE